MHTLLQLALRLAIEEARLDRIRREVSFVTLELVSMDDSNPYALLFKSRQFAALSNELTLSQARLDALYRQAIDLGAQRIVVISA